jgi:hypothetical protein
MLVKTVETIDIKLREIRIHIILLYNISYISIHTCICTYICMLTGACTHMFTHMYIAIIYHRNLYHYINHHDYHDHHYYFYLDL